MNFTRKFSSISCRFPFPEKKAISRCPGILFLCAVFLGASPVAAGTDSSYIQAYPQHLSVRTSIYDSYMALMVTESEDAKEMDYLPNNPVSLGVGVSYPSIPFEISLGYNIGAKGDDNYLRTKAFDIQMNHYGGKYVADASLQNYKGLYIDGEDSSDVANCPDLLIFVMSLGGQYILNGDRFSYRAAFDQSEKQVQSAGSFLLGSGLYYLKIDSDSSFVFRKKHSMTSYQFGINGGYSYNWVPSQRWLVNGSFTLGANLEYNDAVHHLYVSPTALVRASCFYSRVRWLLGISFVLNTVSTMYQYDKDTGINLGYGRVYITYVRKFGL